RGDHANQHAAAGHDRHVVESSIAMIAVACATKPSRSRKRHAGALTCGWGGNRCVCRDIAAPSLRKPAHRSRPFRWHATCCHLIRTKMRIILVSPFPAERTALQQLLAEDGHHVAAVPTRPEGFELAAKGRVDAIIADAQVIGLDGVALMRELSDRG